MQVQIFTFNAFQENTFVVSDETRECVIIDPGCSTYEERQLLTQYIEQQGLTVKHLLNTHAHIDHILGNEFVKRTYHTKLHMHPNDKPIYESAISRSEFWGFKGYVHTDVDVWLNEGDVITFGNQQLEVVFVPGHAPGHVAFVSRDEKMCFSGDVLFYNSVGRTDLPLCSHDELMNSIFNKILPLGDDMVIFPGHGPQTTVGRERVRNPFLQ
jgi:hydroxyacylglutathione hydrolase